MASSSEPKKIYDVFLSFRGADLRNNFIGHLYQALNRDGVYTFRDSEELKKGDQISPVLMKAIEESCIAIIVFSEDYASSRWCLEELAKIIECKEQKNLIVLPVFYKVDPREVREGRESYKTSLAKHEFKLGNDSEKVKRWKKALSDAGNLSGWHLNDGDESELIQEIVNKISTYLDRPLHVAKHPIGIYSRVTELKSMLKFESNDGVLMVGLWGQGGIGKTCLAKALYNALFRKFEGACFLANVRETSKDSRGLVTLQETILNDILLSQQRLKVSNVDVGSNLIQHRLGRKKVLLILDDVDDLRQLNALAGEGKWFGNGSRIIITTRNKHLLIGHGIDLHHVYEVKELDKSAAHELLSKHAGLTHQKLKIRTDLVDSVLNHAKGLPLALEVLGSFLCGRRDDEWESTLDKISSAPNKDINDVLKISYDGLEANEREIFLHIACFFKGWETQNIKKILDSCDLKAIIGIQILIERSLIGTMFEKIQMHDLIQLMGMDIVNQESDDPGRRSRLWLYDDVVEVVSSEMDCATKAIVLQLPKRTKIHIGPDTLKKMRRLRLLILCNVDNSFQGPICLPNELRWFRWAGCAPRISEFSSGQKKLVGLDMSNCSITVVPNQFKAFQNLKYINFNDCKSIFRIPDLSCSPNIEELHFSNCNNLEEAHESIAYLDKLQVLNLRNCYGLSVFPNVLKLKNLRALDLCYCMKFERFPDIPQKLEGLKELMLERTAIKELPTSIENFVALKKMHIYYCENLERLPSSIYKLQNLETLKVKGCTNLIEFPEYKDSADQCKKIGLSNLRLLSVKRCNLSEVGFLENLSCFPLLDKLNLRENNITTLPTSINERDHLFYLNVEDCYQLQEIPKVPPFLRYLAAHNCKSLRKNQDLTSIHHIVHKGLAPTVGSPDMKEWDIFLAVLPGGELPQWVVPIKEGSISFMISKDLYDKFLGLAFCVILGDGDDEKGVFSDFWLKALVNGKVYNRQGRCCKFLYSDHIFVDYLLPCELWGEVDFAQFDGRYVEFGVRLDGENMKKWGFRIICKQLEDNLKAELQDNQLIDLALLYEVGYGSTDLATERSQVHEDNSREANLQEDLRNCQMSTRKHTQIVSGLEAKSSHMHGDSSMEIDLPKNFQDCQMSIEEHSQRGSKRKHELILPQGWLHL